MIPAEVLGRWNVAACDQSMEFFNSIHPKETFAFEAARPRLQNPIQDAPSTVSGLY
jgi:hypothetical protein